MLTWTTLLGTTAAGLTAFSNLPQVLKCWRTGQTDDLSLKMLLSLSAGTGLWIAYGLMQGDPVIIGANGVTPGANGIAATLIVGVFAYAMNTPSFHTGNRSNGSASACTIRVASPNGDRHRGKETEQPSMPRNAGRYFSVEL